MKGVGQTAPAENAFAKFRKMTVPLGKGAPTNEMGCSLMYNEFIVYDVAQVKIEYLIKCKFNYPNRGFF